MSTYFHKTAESEGDALMGAHRSNEARKLYDPEANFVEESSREKVVNRWSIMGIGSAVIATTIIVVAMSSSTTPKIMHGQTASSAVSPSSSPKTSRSTSYRKNPMRSDYKLLNEDEKSALFKKFQVERAKKYATKHEEDLRFSHFKTFLADVDARNAAELQAGGTAVHGITKFADLSPEEMKKRYLNYVKPTKSAKAKTSPTAVTYTGNSTSVDWSGIYTTPVRDQGYCGSCWAFSATEQLESDAIREGLLTTATYLSEQQVVSCDVYDWGCEGGNTETAYMYIAKSGGLVTDSDYPYTSYWAVTGSCQTSKLTSRILTIDGFYTLKSETEMQNYVLSTGPLSVCLDASSWASYTGGIVSTCGMDVDHCVQVVGVDTENKYWKLRNSWGTDWGVDGYIYLSLGSNTCDITYDPTYVKPSAVSSSSSSKSSKSNSHSAKASAAASKH